MARPPSRRSERRHPGDVELNLLPFMNLMTLLIPFLLMSATFVHLATVNASMPAIAKTPAVPDDGPTLDLKLAVTPDTFILRGRGGTQAEFISEYATVDQLQAAATELKEEWPGETTFVIASDGDVAWHRLIAAMDAMREPPDDASGHRVLFDQPVFAGGLSQPE